MSWTGAFSSIGQISASADLVSLISDGTDLYASVGAGVGKLYKWAGGTSWTDCGTPNANVGMDLVSGDTIYGYDINYSPYIWKWTSPSTWTGIGADWSGSGFTEIRGAYFNSNLYCALQSVNAGSTHEPLYVYSGSGTTWTAIDKFAAEDRVFDIKTNDGDTYLYVLGRHTTSTDICLWRYDGTELVELDNHTISAFTDGRILWIDGESVYFYNNSGNYAIYKYTAGTATITEYIAHASLPSVAGYSWKTYGLYNNQIMLGMNDSDTPACKIYYYDGDWILVETITTTMGTSGPTMIIEHGDRLYIGGGSHVVPS